MTSRSIQAGVQQAWLLFHDTNGDPSGDTTTPLANGQIRGSYPFRGIQTMPTGIPESDAVNVPGDDTSLGSIGFGSDAPRQFVMNFGYQDLNLDGELQNTAVETLGDIEMGLIDSPDAVLATVSLIVQSKAVVNGVSSWTGYIYPSVQIQPLGRETFAGRTDGVIRYKGTAQLAFNNPWGVTIVNKSGTPTSGYARPFKSPNPLTMDAFRGNGILASWTLAKSPISATKTRPYSDKIALGVSSVNPTTRVMVLDTVVVVSRPAVVLYEYPL
jgi:hypothetical protein